MHLDNLRRAPALDRSLRSHFRLVEPSDAEFICSLRNDPTLNRHLNAPPSTPEGQRQWIEGYKEREQAGSEFYFVISSDGRDYGVVRLYDFRDIPRSFCWGSWIIRPDRPSGLVTYSAVLVYEIGFESLGFEQSHFDVRKQNEGVLAFHRRANAIPTGETEDDFLFEFPSRLWPAFRDGSAAQISSHRLNQTMSTNPSSAFA